MARRRLKSSDLLRALEKLAGQSCTVRAFIDGKGRPRRVLRSLGPGGSGLGYSQLNELLLLLGFDRVTHAFFQFLIDGTVRYTDGAAIKSFKQLEQGVDRFRALGLLLYGNVKYAFKALSTDPGLLEDKLDQLKPVAVKHFRRRHEPVLDIQQIPAEQTYFLGYMIERELEARLKKNPDDLEARSHERQRKKVIEIGKRNQEAYLASDHLDVYVATSMRLPHEFLAVNRLGKAIFSHLSLGSLKLRWFDPTQAYCRDRIDKGLSEALMLRRAKCTIYLAQESDTLGKDSELASTLAQGKPVIAFVPEVRKGFARQLIAELAVAYPRTDRRQLLLDQLRIVEPSAAWTDELVRKWVQEPASMDFEVALNRLQTGLAKHYNDRAKTLKETHPLGVQVNLATGVANGVLVARTVAQCAALVRRIVTTTLQFRVSEEDGATVLRETSSACVFRIATGDVMLTNAFWNFYLDPSQ